MNSLCLCVEKEADNGVLYYKNSTAQLLIAVRPPYFHSIVQSIAYFLTPHCQILHKDAFYCS